MNILVTGRGGASGSWQIRGEQLGRAIGATVLANAIDIAPFDVAVVVKRTPRDLVHRIRQAGVPLVYDVVDGWPQPEGNRWSEAECMAWLEGQVKFLQPAGIVAATQAMAEDCAAFGVPVLALPHHAKPGQRVNPIRDKVQRVGYQGSWRYIEHWGPQMAAECARRGWEWDPEARDLADLDIVVAVRDQDGYAPRRWKSNVKAANAQATGTPMVCNREAGYRCRGLLFADSMDEMRTALNELEPHDVRQAVSVELRTSVPTLESVASIYREWLHARRV